MERQKYENKYLPEGYLIDTDMNVMYTSSLRMLERAMRQGRILEGMATVCNCTDMSLTVDLGFARGIIPKEEALLCAEESRDIAVITRVGNPVCFKVLSVRERGGKPEIILSRRAAQKECRDRYISRLVPGDIIPAAVTHLDPFGAFVDIGCGIISLICVDCISVSRIFHPSDRLTTGQRIMSVVKSVDRESGRIYMSLRELLGTWEENAALFSPASTVAGIIRSVEDYGVFVELQPNLAGLAEVRDDVSPGECCSVYIKNIIPDRMKIKLVIIDTHAAPQREQLKYYVNTDAVRHMDVWRYSPTPCRKVIETDFTAGGQCPAESRR